MQKLNFTPTGNLSDELVDQIRTMIVDERLPEGQRINEVHLAEQLGISRTPLREALTRLISEGALEAIPRRGFFVKALSIEEVNDIYPIRALLDPEALALSGLPNAEQMQYLNQLNQAILAETEPFNIIALDDAWHLALIQNCPNKVIFDLIHQFMLRTRRYEYGLMKSKDNVNTAIEIHQAIMDALEAGDLPAACQALKENMEHGRKPIVQWLQSRDSETGGTS